MKSPKQYWSALWAGLSKQPETAAMKDQVIAVLDSFNFRYQIVEDDEEYTRLDLTINGSHGHLQNTTEVFHRDAAVRILAILPNTIPEHKRTEVTEFITRINHGSPLGMFEFDIDTGRLRYNCTFRYIPNVNMESVYEQNFDACVMRLNAFTPAVLSIAYSDTSAAEQVQLIENRVNPELN